jgi:hypothetical protein
MRVLKEADGVRPGDTHCPGVRRSITRPADLDVVRASYDRVADRYVAMGAGRLDAHPWLRAALAAFTEVARPDR